MRADAALSALEEGTERRCDLCHPDPDQGALAVTECQLCGRDLCGRHAVPLRFWLGMGCRTCVPQRTCRFCCQPVRNRCTGCGTALCRLHTQELGGRISCAACLYGQPVGRLP